jgi:hypothetical protein
LSYVLEVYLDYRSLFRIVATSSRYSLFFKADSKYMIHVAILGQN